MDLQYFLDHKEDLFLIATSVVAAASAIANLTPNTHDNAIVDKVGKVVHFLAINWSRNTKPGA